MIKIDYTGQIISGWKILEQGEVYVSPTGHRNKRWLCQCKKCGRIALRTISNIKGHPCSCPPDPSEYNHPKNIRDLTGRRLGLLTVVKKLPPRKDAPNRSAWYQCLCDCGNVCEMPAQTLTLHQSRYPRNCGCIKTLPLEERRKLLLGSSGIEARQKYQRGINVGEIYNSYEVIEILEDREYPSGQKQKQCKVRCTICGEEKVMSTSRAKYEVCKHRGRFK